MDHSFDHPVSAKNKQRLLDADVAWEFLLQIVAQARERRLLSEEHFKHGRDAAESLGVSEEFPVTG